MQINTVPVAAVTQAQLYFDAIKLAPLKNGRRLLRQSVGTLTLRADGYGSTLVPLCQIEVQEGPHHHGHRLDARTTAALPCRFIRRRYDEPLA